MAADLDYVDRFRAQAGLISWDPNDLRSCSTGSDLARILHVAALLEEDTAITVRQGASLGMHRCADLAVFLPQWDAEEAEHGRALRCLIEGQDYEAPSPAPRSIGLRRRTLARIPASTFARVPQTSFLFCVLGAAAEYVATTIYAELASRTDSRVVEQLLRSIARQEARHFAFFLAAARVRGRSLSTMNGRLARLVLRTVWEPIGVPTLGAPAWRDMFADWLDDDGFRRRVEMMDRVIDSIPHLEGAGLMRRFLDEIPSR
jgi:hypothetical protein